MIRKSRVCVLVALAGVGCVDDSVNNVVDDVTDDGGSTDDEGGSTDDEGGSTESTDGGGESTDGGGGSTDDGDGSTDDGPELDPPSLHSIIVEPTPVHRPVQGAWPAAAFGGTQYLVVWEDHRLRRPILYGGRVTADGTALDPFGIRLLDLIPEPVDGYEYYGGYQPSVAFDGENFLVVAEVGGRLAGVRVSPAGEVLDPDGFLIAAPELASRPSLGFDGEQYVVAWSEWAGVFRARVQPDATVLDPGGALVLIAPDQPVGVSFDGTHTLLSWINYDDDCDDYPCRGVDASRIAEDGTLIDDPPLRLSIEGEPVMHQVAGFDGTNHVIVWSLEDAFGFDGGIRAARVTPEGTNLDPGGFVVDAGGDYEHIHRLDMAAASGRSIVVWSAAYSGDDFYGYWADPVRAAQIATDGTTGVYPSDVFPIGLEAMVAAHPDGALLLWRDGFNRYPDYPPIVGTRLDAAGVPVVDSVVAPASPASRQDVQAVASDGQNFFVLWTDTRDPTSEGRALLGARIGADGTPLDLESLQFTSTAIGSADVVFDGANFVVTWADPLILDEYPPSLYEDSYFNTVRVSPAGERLDEEPLQPPLCRKVAGASDGTHTLLVGRECGEEGHLALLLDQQGAVASDPVPIAGEQERPTAVSFDGTGYLVVWSDQNHLFGQRINVAGALEGQPFSVNVSQHWKAAGGGGIHLLVQDFANGIGATRVSSDGQVLDPGGLPIATLDIDYWCTEPDLSNCSESSVAFDGEDFVIAWRAPSIPGHINTLDLYAVKVSPEGDVSPRFLVSQEPEREGAPFVAANGEGQVLAAYNRYVAGPPYDTRRAVARLLP
jgi:hypothetical protein